MAKKPKPKTPAAKRKDSEGIVIAKRIGFSDLVPDRKAMKEKITKSKKSEVVGTIIGVVTGVMQKPSNLDPTKMNNMLVGMFEAMPTDPTAATLQSTKCFIPDHIYAPIAAAINAGQENIEFAIEVAIAPMEKSPVGYEWQSRTVGNFTENDPLAGVRARLGNVKPKALPSS